MCVDNSGIAIGIVEGKRVQWYRAHSFNRAVKPGKICIFAYDMNRTSTTIPVRLLAGVIAIRDITLHTANDLPCILTREVKDNE